MPTFHFFSKGKKVDEVVGANVADIERKINSQSGATKASFGGTGRSLGSGASVAPQASNDAGPISMTNAFIALAVLYIFYKVLHKFVGV